MNLIKGINMIFIIIICSYIGIIKAKKFETRLIELKKFQNALTMFKTKIEFTYEPIKNIFEEISKIIYLEEKNIFKLVIESEDEINQAWKISVDEFHEVFNKEDIDVIKMFGKLLGKTDIEGQVSEILLTQNLIEKQIEKAEYEKSKNSKLYKSMGVICGLGICIILV
ncbi:MAG: stage III sporulation protein AB [Clostridia bacterium]|nr:stage III sporulation protein AB [Clostridia bacterium]